jgi:hypothetical protein
LPLGPDASSGPFESVTKSLVVTADYAPHRIDVATEDGIIIDVLSPRESAREPQG